MSIEAKNKKELRDLAIKIRIARRWAELHFNSDEAGKSSSWLEATRPSFWVEYPAPDKMVVTPSIFGMKGSSLRILYQLHFNSKDKTFMTWEPDKQWKGTRVTSLKVGCIPAEDVDAILKNPTLKVEKKEVNNDNRI